MWPFNPVPMNEPEATQFDREQRRFSSRTDLCFKILNFIVTIVALILLYNVPNQTAASTISNINRDILQLNLTIGDMREAVARHEFRLYLNKEESISHIMEIRRNKWELDSLISTVGQHMEQLDSLTTIAQDSKGKFRDLVSDAQHQYTDIQVLKSKLDSLTTIVQNSKGKFRDLVSDAQVLKSKLDSLTTIVQDNKRKFRQLDTAKDELEMLHSDIRVINARLYSLTTNRKAIQAYQKLSSDGPYTRDEL
ncbi:hypothetical protein COCSADRAFT_94396 [Bipolaris sorokiniana ND90Pr]|uniref:Uncharacterized protein n=1 Tax=Cochliobolus sativus (strain ND90Pr / ATCC 201652) TaxID=665912 RepID=M2R5V2_COCSN|nr:uncharacterized protein COCSADRAFT_94396 [Bipolaris sorokiniana ND90Pr]EMD62549.1 hypothetical protein COCSADRAFT_94396 [Bipolaris sorokiniana ND90Pr]